jgi:hypothetical protein
MRGIHPRVCGTDQMLGCRAASLLENSPATRIMAARMTKTARFIAFAASLALASCQNPADPAANVSDPYASNYNDGFYNPYPGQGGRVQPGAQPPIRMPLAGRLRSLPPPPRAARSQKPSPAARRRKSPPRAPRSRNPNRSPNPPAARSTRSQRVIRSTPSP